MESSTLVILVSRLAQAGGALVLALVLVGFHRLYRREYLRTWAWSWGAFCVGMGASALTLHLDHNSQLSPALGTGLTIVFLIAGYWQIAWLLFGTFELATTQLVTQRVQRTVLGLLVALAVVPVATALVLDGTVDARTSEMIRALCLAAAFLIASYWVWNAGNEEVSAGMGQRIMAGAFLVSMLQEAHHLAIHLARGAIEVTPRYLAYLTPIDFLLQFLLSVAMVIWLLEEERRRVLAASARAEHLAYHDTLTDLPNRNLLVQNMAAALHRAERRQEGRSAVLFLDLDRFKVINDSLGHSYGDEILRSITERLRRNLLETETVARMGGDGFAVLLPVVSSEWKIAQMAEKLLGLIRRPFAVQGTELYVTASIGISRFPDDGGDPDELIKKAEIAMYHAKEHGGDQYQVYAPTMDANALERLALENDLRKALVHGELVLFYQPVLDARTGVIEGVEALLRWQHPERGLMGPAEFLWLAEVTGMTNAVDLWVLKTACREISEWHKDGADVRVAVNLSARPFQRPDLLDRIQEVLAETGLPPSMLQLEITETLAMQNAEASQSVLRGLKELGIRIAIDDFGTGYSSLSYLTTLPIDILKVDRSFVSGLGTSRGSGEITAAVISLAHSLKLDVVAEGVENETQLEILRSQGCNKVQGYLFSPPIPAALCREKALEGRMSIPRSATAI
ncbi:MAG: putative bifunctional diguanylate cyclase/phosphodiesterase [Thermoanaerobaculia bacterium]